jgi:ElaB/YqjD/DUF883 family membrane-anchored ribosome-binding protein
MSDDLASELRALKEDVVSLRAELSRLRAAPGTEAGEDAFATAGSGAKLREMVQRAYEKVRDRSQDVLDKGRDKVREYPLTTVFVALLTGVVIGMLLRRSRE